MASTAGKLALVKVTGTPTAFTAEAAANTGDNQIYRITNTAKRVWDRTATITVKVGGVATGETYTLDRLRGRVTFATVDAGRGAVTLDGTYLPVSTAARAKGFSWTITAQNLDDSDFAAVQANGGMRTRVQGLQDVSGSIDRRWTIDTYFADALLAGSPVVIEFFLDYTGQADLICWALLNKSQVQSAVDGLAEENIEFQGTADADERAVSLS